MADSLVADYDPVELAQELVEVVVEVLPVGAAGVMLADHAGRLQVLASTSEETRLLELFQIQSAAGPCLAAYAEGHQVLVPDLDEQRRRWPNFTDRARAEGWTSVYALPMRLRQERIGALNLFAAAGPDRLSATDTAVAQALADATTIGILHARVLADSVSVAAQLQGALNSRTVIEQAKGVLAERGGLEMDSAFEFLRAYARAHTIRMLDLARAVIDGTADTAAILADHDRTVPKRRDYENN
ncbi:GAF domain-containing protein [Nocardia tenerifensis]|uniref:GAF domain-containing protein n=1 Tax=Nocardia tenerifensis TaxID=228006 RepID=A0A318L0G2_9NOCA|nr:GAF and ANTAR domain-containing protein [Nocardia tenerifensis]PXX71614.1 GAF domain-containing protein [Nocardia tenerifensis]